MNCPFCNYPNEPNAPFCVNCGASLPTQGGKTAAPAQQPPPPAGAPPPAASYGSGGQHVPVISSQYRPQAGAPQPQVPPHAGKKKGASGCLIAAIVVGAALLLAGGGLAVFVAFGYFGFRRTMHEEEQKRAEAAAAAGEEETRKEKEARGENEQEVENEGEEEEENPAVAEMSKDYLYQSQIFRLKDKIQYAGSEFSVRKAVKLHPPSAFPGSPRLKKGEVVAEVEVVIYGDTKLGKFRVLLIDGSGRKNTAENSIEKYLELPDDPGEIHKRWKEVSRIKSKKTYHLHRCFSVEEEHAEHFIVEIKNLNIDRVLWIRAKHE